MPKLMRLFWPLDAAGNGQAGALVGWCNSERDFLVAAVLPGVEARDAEHALRNGSLLRSQHPLERLLRRCGGRPLQVLGTFNGPCEGRLSLRQTADDLAPRILDRGDAEAVQIFVLERPNPWQMQYFSLAPLSLAARPQLDKEDKAEQQRKERLIAKVKQHTVVRHVHTAQEMALPAIISQINCSAELEGLMRRNIGCVGVQRPRSLSELAVQFATELGARVLGGMPKRARYLSVRALGTLLVMLRVAAEVLLTLLNKRLWNISIRDVSATAQQVDMRLQQFCHWPGQWVAITRRGRDWASCSEGHAEYVRFYNSLWLVANDLVFGVALGTYLLQHADYVAARADEAVATASVAGLQGLVRWLMDWPAGLKLNNDLAYFLGDMFLWVMEYWDGSMRQLRPLLPRAVQLIALSSFVGASLPISLLSDALSLLTLHIWSFYLASARLYSWQLTVIYSLFQLFRGNKVNVLRNRIDRCDYDLDQLLLGTILFTLLFFLLPTVAVFYVTFAGGKMVIITLQALLDTALACLNYFPLFALMLRVKDPRRLPGGIRFELCPSVDSTVPTAHVRLKPISLPLSHIFAQYAQLGVSLRRHYLSAHVAKCLATGQDVPSMQRQGLYALQYRMLPEHKLSISELWKLLTEMDCK
ncbi:Gpi1-domain-containing protein [Piedraia hortae CBS 480.64]|uniref:Gpi1-domain-containing protein n=1 Tax=Piedraia hortae CBS 480.64 TaxID=1314780 RepID=A0A6A7C9Y5_9PEZI|nr:Gpi1-domain-containing protein [Piedraia hortae CBS 480.64]